MSLSFNLWGEIPGFRLSPRIDFSYLSNWVLFYASFLVACWLLAPASKWQGAKYVSSSMFVFHIASIPVASGLISLRSLVKTTEKWCGLTYQENFWGWNEHEWPFSFLSQPYIYGGPRSLPFSPTSAPMVVGHGVPLLRSPIPNLCLVESVHLQSKEGFTFLAITCKVTDRFRWNFHVMRSGLFHGWQRPLTAIVTNLTVRHL